MQLFTCVSLGGHIDRSGFARRDSCYPAIRSVVLHPEPPTLSLVFSLPAYRCFLTCSHFHSGPPLIFLSFLSVCRSRNRLNLSQACPDTCGVLITSKDLHPVCLGLRHAEEGFGRTTKIAVIALGCLKSSCSAILKVSRPSVSIFVILIQVGDTAMTT